MAFGGYKENVTLTGCDSKGYNNLKALKPFPSIPRRAGLPFNPFGGGAGSWPFRIFLMWS